MCKFPLNYQTILSVLARLSARSCGSPVSSANDTSVRFNTFGRLAVL